MGRVICQGRRMKVLLRLALLTLCGAAGILIAVRVAGPRPQNVAAVSTSMSATAVVIPASAGPQEATNDSEPDKNTTPTKPLPRVAAQFPDTGELPEGIDASLLKDLSDEQLQGYVGQALEVMRRN